MTEIDLRPYTNTRLAVIYVGSFTELPPELSTLSVSDLDAFYNTLDMWCPEDAAPLKVLFSTPIPGIKQHLANYHDWHVVLAGEVLLNNDLVDGVKTEYLQRGYGILEIRADGEEYTPCIRPTGVRIELRELPYREEEK